MPDRVALPVPVPTVTILSAVIFSVFCNILVWSQGKDEENMEYHR